METLKGKYPKLSKAPILLAILEIKYSSKKSIDNSIFLNLTQKVKKDYPISQKTNTAKIQINPNDPKTPLSLKMMATEGIIFTSESKLREFFISKNTFTFKQHAPYKDWEEFTEMALKAWNECLTICDPAQILRISVRYINAFEIRSESRNVDTKDFFKSFIEINALNDDRATRFLLRYTIPENKENMTSHFTLEAQETLNEIFPFILDIDTLYVRPFDYNSEVFTGILSRLRNRKNEIFFENLTDKTIELFK